MSRGNDGSLPDDAGLARVFGLEAVPNDLARPDGLLGRDVEGERRRRVLSERLRGRGDTVVGDLRLRPLESRPDRLMEMLRESIFLVNPR